MKVAQRFSAGNQGKAGPSRRDARSVRLLASNTTSRAQAVIGRPNGTYRKKKANPARKCRGLAATEAIACNTKKCEG
jgi:hypothetical protein